MWTYQTTRAATEVVSASSLTGSGQQGGTSQVTASADLVTDSQYYSATSVTRHSWSSTATQGAYGASSRYQESYSTERLEIYSNGEMGSESVAEGFVTSADSSVVWDFTSSVTRETRYTYTYGPFGGFTTSSTSSSSSTAGRTLGSYRSATETAGTGVTAESTTTVTATRSARTVSAGALTTSATTQTLTTSTTLATTTATTTYATVASTTLTAPVAVVRFTELEASEQGWEATYSGVAAGFIAGLGATWSKRTGTFTPLASTRPVASLATYTRSHEVSAGETLTLTTSLATTLTHTHTTNASVLPATATATRTLQAIATSTVKLTRQRWTATAASTHTGVLSLHDTRASTVTVLATGSVPLTHNVNASSTATAPLALTWTTTTAVSLRRDAAPVAFSGTTVVTQAYDVPFSTTASSSSSWTSSTSTVVTATATETTGTHIEEVFVTSETYTEECGVPPPATNSGSISFLIGATRHVVYGSTTHNGPVDHTASEVEYEESTIEDTRTTTSTATASTSITDSESGTHWVGGPANLTESYAAQQEQGISVTYPSLVGGVLAAASVPWTVLAHSAAGGFALPHKLAGTDTLCRDLSLAGGATLFYPWWASHAGPGGPVTPMLYPEPRAYAQGGTRFTVQWMSTATALDWTTASGDTTTSATFRAVFSYAQSATWFGHQSARGTSTSVPDGSAVTVGSALGGVPERSEFRAAAVYPPGVRHATEQTGGTTSASTTSALTSAELRSASNVGMAFPSSNESAWSLTQQETRWTFDDAFSGGGFSPVLDLASLTPAGGSFFPATVTLSKFPSL